MFFNKSVDKVMAVFQKTITDLDAVAERNTFAATTYTDAARTLLVRADMAQAEAKRARTISAKLNDIFSS